jgi:biopolymer transport protein ExbB/TolQ
MAGKVVRCPNCNNKIAVPAEPDVAPVIHPVGQVIDAEKRSATPNKVFRVKKQAQEQTQGQKAPTPSLQRSTSIGGGESGTQVSGLVTGLVGLGLVIGFYLIVLLFRGMYFGDLFLQRGWVPYVEAFLFWWAVAILVFKSRKLARQKQCMMFDILPEEISPDITRESIDQFIEHASFLRAKASDSFLTRRVLKVLEHFRVRNSNPEAATVLSAQSDVDANDVQSSYTLLKIFIWAIPILGFIGTVQGLGEAVGGFASGMGNTDDVAVLKNSLGMITKGLAVAFDTTLIALIMAIPLMFFMSAMQKAEEDVLNSIDEFCTENLLKRLNELRNDLTTDEGKQDMIAQMIASLGQLFEQQQARANEWSTKLETMGEAISKQVAEGWKGTQEGLQKQYEEHIKAVRSLNEEMAGKSVGVLKEITEVQLKMVEMQKHTATLLKEQADTASQNLKCTQDQVEKFQNVFSLFGEQVIALNRKLEKGVSEAGKTTSGATVKSTFWQRIVGIK